MDSNEKKGKRPRIGARPISAANMDSHTTSDFEQTSKEGSQQEHRSYGNQGYNSNRPYQQRPYNNRQGGYQNNRYNNQGEDTRTTATTIARVDTNRDPTLHRPKGLPQMEQQTSPPRPTKQHPRLQVISPVTTTTARVDTSRVDTSPAIIITVRADMATTTARADISHAERRAVTETTTARVDTSSVEHRAVTETTTARADMATKVPARTSSVCHREDAASLRVQNVWNMKWRFRIPTNRFASTSI